jgi:hypothetical protein
VRSISGASSGGALGAPTHRPLRLPAGARQPGVPAADPRLRGLLSGGWDEFRRSAVARHRARAAGDRGFVGGRGGGRVHVAGRGRRAGVRPPSAPGVGQVVAVRGQHGARRVARRHTARMARRPADAAAVRRIARGLLAVARVGQCGQVHPAGRADAGRAAARREHPSTSVPRSRGPLLPVCW